ncbi:MAG: UDP-N-acetylmuramoyl-L-alanine--D-glutamate ligase [Candidatus Colwellbacteria bacterium]|nr:UDP-N-acetylmuramoyl-L-alanine--D-glutamate ligase [Candidatus Colwellbacteria bacterium]
MRTLLKTAILGFGREGKAVLRFLRNHNVKNTSILDRKFDKDYLKNLNQFDIIYRSPGVPYNLREIQAAIKSGVEISCATDLFFQNAKGRIIGITGTKGKGTTSTLIYKILKAAGKDVYLAGNIGKPAIDILPKLKKNSITVLELSSFQLQDLKHSPNISVVLGIYPDHLDAHKNFKEYLNAKSSVTRYQTREDKVFYLSSDKYSALLGKMSKGRKIPVDFKKFNLFKEKDLKILGRHNFKNAVIAATVAKNLGIPSKTIIKVVKNYRGLPYRLEFIKTIRGRKIYNDSASTNPMTTVAAIKSFATPNIMIVGGKDKNLDYRPLGKALSAKGGSTSGGKNSATYLTILFGENKFKIKKALRGNKFAMVSNLKTALKLALKNSKPGDAIVFSPGSTSFDMFIDYKDRGRKFNEIVKNMSN